MLLSNEAELLAMEAEKYSGLNPIVVDNNNLTIGLDSGFMDAVSSISGGISGLDNKLDISAFTGYSAGLDSGLSNAFETVHNDITELQGDTSYLSGSIDYLSGVVTTGLSAYSAGQNINITDYVISGKDWLDTIQEASANAYNEATALIPPAFDPSYMSGAIDNKLDTTSFSTVSGDFATTGDLQNYATTSWVSNINTAIRNDMGTIATNTANNYSAITSTSSFLSGAVDNKLDTTAFSDVSSTFLTAHQSLADYATTAWVDSQGYLTAHQPISANEWNNVYETVNTNSATWSGGTVESYDLSAGNNIQIVKDDVNSAISIAVTGFNQTNWDNSYTALTSNSANWNDTRSTVQTNSASWGQGGSSGDMAVSNLDYTTQWDEEGNEFSTISGYDGSAFGLGSFYVTNSDSILKNGGDSLIEINDNGIRLDNPDGGYSNQNSFYGGDYFHIGSYTNTLAYIEGYADGHIDLFDANHVSGTLDVSSISSWNDVHNTVQTNSASWGQGGGGITADIYGISAVAPIYANIENSALWISADMDDYATTANLAYVSGVVGNVESLLAQL